MKRVLVTGAAGFIGSNLTDRLLAEGLEVVGYDNFSTGQEPFLKGALANPRFTLARGDTLDATALIAAMKGCDTVFHLAANADVRFGTQHTGKDLQQNTVATFSVLESARACGVSRFVFASTGSVYGECPVIPTPEDAPFPVQTSLYAASKLAGEGMLSAYAEGFGLDVVIFRFVSILGERYTHGHVYDFCRQLKAHPDYLEVLGDGTQRKSYLYVGDCVEAIVRVVTQREAAGGRGVTSIYNLGTDAHVTVRDSIACICGCLGLNPELRFSGGSRGWIGDNPFIFLDTARIRATGWAPKLTIQQGIEATVRWLEANPWVYESRG